MRTTKVHHDNGYVYTYIDGEVEPLCEPGTLITLRHEDLKEGMEVEVGGHAEGAKVTQDVNGDWYVHFP